MNKRKHVGLLLLLVWMVTCQGFYSARAEETPYIWPAPNALIISGRYEKGKHEALDITGPEGSEIVASREGVVVELFTGCQNEDGWETHVSCTSAGCSEASRNNAPYGGFCNRGLGNGVVIRHEDDSYAVYGHLNALDSMLSIGQHVRQGQPLGPMGSTGRSTGRHLHFALTKPQSNGYTQKRRNPNEVLSGFAVVTTTEAKNITDSGAEVYGKIAYVGDARPTEAGVYVGASPNDLVKALRFEENEIPDTSNIRMWYYFMSFGGEKLSPQTTYYWRAYAVVEDEECFGEIHSFTTAPPCAP